MMKHTDAVDRGSRHRQGTINDWVGLQLAALVALMSVGVGTPSSAWSAEPGPVQAGVMHQVAATQNQLDPAEAAENRDCLRCHSMATLGYRDPATGKIIHLSVNPDALAHSVHGQLACRECHEGDYQHYPHPAELSAADLSCVQCHEDNPDNTEIDFRMIDREYQASVHVLSKDPEVKGFSCHSCHDPHLFRASTMGRKIPEIVRYDNQICLSCHEDLRDPLALSHAWLPNPNKHWESVRCLDCHTPLTDNGRPVSHEILSAKDSNQNCVNCHSADQDLLNRLYQYRSQEDIKERGYFAKAVFNDAYIVGMSRNKPIDALALIIMALTILGVGLHGYGRYRAYRSLREQQTTALSQGDNQ